MGSIECVFLVIRRSCECRERWIIVPAVINRSALNSACVSKWKKVRESKCKDSLIIITPNCLKVERAIIFFMSVSITATILAINIVSVEDNNKNW